MFDGLKKKFSNFIESLHKKEEEKVEVEAAAERRAKELHAGKLHETTQPKMATEAEHERGAYGRMKAEESKKNPERREGPPNLHAGVTIGARLKGTILRQVRISDADVELFLEQLKYGLLQSDVNYGVAERILESIRKNLVGKSLPYKDIDREITGVIRGAIVEMLGSGDKIDLLGIASSKKRANELPFRILFIGPNGAGKTTTMAKIANLFLKNGFSCVLSASDTFRAAAIEQTMHHANKLGIEAIKGAYGSDPASIAFDAIAHAKARGIDVVLIDSAGRQETNKSLMEEVKKIARVTKPDIKIFVGESIAGNALLEQVREFKEAIGIDGIILTKLDADAKGGNTLSILTETSVPILYFGTGERYEDLLAYKPDFIIENIMPNN